MPELAYELLIDGAPASPELLAAVQQIEVEDHATMADMLRLRLAIAVRPDGGRWTVLDDGVFARLSRVQVRVGVGRGPAQPLIDAYVVESSADLGAGPGGASLEVVAMDPTTLMGLEEKVRAWPDMADAEIASTIFGEYGFAAVVEETRPARQELSETVMQRGSDLQFLRELADRNGCEVYLDLDASGRVHGHFHPPRVGEEPQAVLSVNMGEATNVDAFRARHDMLRPAVASAVALDPETAEDQPGEAEGSGQRPMGRRPPAADRPRKVLLSRTGVAKAAELQQLAASVADRSAWAITAEGELNTLSFGGILRAKRPVLVRGAGPGLSGLYYVDRVQHVLAGGSYAQRFSLRRNATGLSGSESFADRGGRGAPAPAPRRRA